LEIEQVIQKLIHTSINASNLNYWTRLWFIVYNYMNEKNEFAGDCNRWEKKASPDSHDESGYTFLLNSVHLSKLSIHRLFQVCNNSILAWQMTDLCTLFSLFAESYIASFFTHLTFLSVVLSVPIITNNFDKSYIRSVFLQVIFVVVFENIAFYNPSGFWQYNNQSWL